MSTHSPKDKLTRRAAALAKAKERLRAQLAAAAQTARDAQAAGMADAGQFARKPR